MRKVIITYGLIAGAIVVVLMYLTMPIGKENGNYDLGMVLGYVSMIAALSMIFFGVKAFRDKYLNGSITFGKALLTGLAITLVAGIVYCIGWEIYYNTVAPDFMTDYTNFYIEKMKDEGASQAEIDEMTASMDAMAENYKNPVVRFGMTLLEIFPVGLVISLVCAVLFRSKNFLPVTD
ncbi:MAG: DUF4199 domain-containing protein [Imperialibacter sp.]|uniref:DUF4199 domain-containing protein n=1 Tax=Imperialibacter sp. TaxID=2038411 RepID=UPI0032EF955E